MLWQAFTEACIVKVFAETMPSFTGPLKAVMMALCRLYAVTGILDNLGDFLVVREVCLAIYMMYLKSFE